MSLLTSLRSWLRRPALCWPAVARRARLLLEPLEDRCVPDAGLRSAIGTFAPDTAAWYLRHTPSPGAPEVAPFAYGGAGWHAVAADWTGTGIFSVAAFNPNTATWYLRGTATAGSPDVATFRFGGANWLPVAGDWDGTGKAGIGVFDPNTATWYLKDSAAPGAAEHVFRFGGTGWLPVVGDWNGDGKTTVGVVDPSTGTWYLKNSNGAGAPDVAPFRYGAPGWVPVAGDWNGDGKTTIGSVDIGTGTWYLRNSNGGGAPDIAPFAYGGPGWQPLVLTASASLPQPAPPPVTSPTGPVVHLQVPASVTGAGFIATVSVVSPASAPLLPTVAIDIDLNHDGTFAGAGETGYATATLDNAGAATVPLHGLAPGTYSIRARAFNANGEGLSPVATTQVKAIPADKIPLSFESNQGQTDARVQYLARTRNSTAFLSPAEVVVSATGQLGQAQGSNTSAIDASGAAALPAPGKQLPGSNPPLFRLAQRMDLVGADPNAVAQGLQPLPGKSNYFIGNDPTQWHTGIANYQVIEFQNVYPGVSVRYQGSAGQLKSDYVIAPGSSPDAIALSFPDAQGVEVGADGKLVVATVGGPLTEDAPVAYQVIGGLTHALPSRYVVQGGTQVGIQVDGYDPTQPLTIDPTLVYSTFLGGNNNESAGPNALFVDSSGNAYVSGYTDSANFPASAGVFQSVSGGKRDAFVTKVDPTGATKLYATYLGGKQDEDGATGGVNLANTAIAVDAGGNAYIAGSTASDDFPTTAGVFQTTRKGGNDVFVSKLNPNGSALSYSTYLGGTKDDGNRGVGIAVDAGGNAYVGGNTASNTDFPTTAGAAQTAFGGGTNDGFVTKINPTATATVYSTYLGGSASDEVNALAVDSAGNAYAVGRTVSNNFPVTAGVVQPAFGGGTANAFVTELNPAGSAKVYSTYLGGTGDDSALGVAVDGAGNTYVSGRTSSANFPTTAGALQTTFGGGPNDGFVTKLNPGATTKVFSTYVGGTGDDSASGIALDPAGNIYLTGQTDSPNLLATTTGAVQTALKGGKDAYAIALNPTGATEIFGTYLGGSLDDSGGGIGLDGANNIYLAGNTASTDFPTTAGVFQPNTGGMTDAFLSKISALPPSTSGGGGGPAPVFPDDRFEPNDTSDVATDMGALSGLESFPGLTINRHANGLFDQDWYKWRVPAGGTFDVNLTSIAAGGGDLNVRVFNLNANNTLTELGNSTLHGGVATQGTGVAVPPGAIVYVWVYGFNFAQGTYNLNVNLT